MNHFNCQSTNTLYYDIFNIKQKFERLKNYKTVNKTNKQKIHVLSKSFLKLILTNNFFPFHQQSAHCAPYYGQLMDKLKQVRLNVSSLINCFESDLIIHYQKVVHLH
jgi:hypothetical protein